MSEPLKSWGIGGKQSTLIPVSNGAMRPITKSYVYTPSFSSTTTSTTNRNSYPRHHPRPLVSSLRFAPPRIHQAAQVYRPQRHLRPPIPSSRWVRPSATNYSATAVAAIVPQLPPKFKPPLTTTTPVVTARFSSTAGNQKYAAIVTAAALAPQLQSPPKFIAFAKPPALLSPSAPLKSTSSGPMKPVVNLNKNKTLKFKSKYFPGGVGVLKNKYKLCNDNKSVKGPPKGRRVTVFMPSKATSLKGKKPFNLYSKNNLLKSKSKIIVNKYKFKKKTVAVCKFFLKGHCSKENCPYRHVPSGVTTPKKKRDSTSSLSRRMRKSPALKKRNSLSKRKVGVKKQEGEAPASRYFDTSLDSQPTLSIIPRRLPKDVEQQQQQQQEGNVGGESSGESDKPLVSGGGRGGGGGGKEVKSASDDSDTKSDKPNMPTFFKFSS